MSICGTNVVQKSVMPCPTAPHIWHVFPAPRDARHHVPQQKALDINYLSRKTVRKIKTKPRPLPKPLLLEPLLLLEEVLLVRRIENFVLLVREEPVLDVGCNIPLIIKGVLA